MVAIIWGVTMAHFLCHLGCSHFGALLLDFYFTENSPHSIRSLRLCYMVDLYRYTSPVQHTCFPMLLMPADYHRGSAYSRCPDQPRCWREPYFQSKASAQHGSARPSRTRSIPVYSPSFSSPSSAGAGSLPD